MRDGTQVFLVPQTRRMPGPTPSVARREKRVYYRRQVFWLRTFPRDLPAFAVTALEHVRYSGGTTPDSHGVPC